MLRKHAGIVALVAAFAATMSGAIAVAATTGGGAGRLDDGAALQSKAAISVEGAIRAAQTAATGNLNEVDLEYRGGSLVYNVDVGASDVKVDAATGAVVAVDKDD